MAVFLLNICKFNKCGLEFSSLVELIQHIEDNHIGKLNLNTHKKKSLSELVYPWIVMNNNFRSKAMSPSPLSFYLFWIAQSSIIIIIARII